MRVSSGGSVGIGTTSPGTKMHIYSTQPALRIEGTSASGYAKLELIGNGSGTGYVQKNGSTNTSGLFSIESGGAYEMRFSNSASGSGERFTFYENSIEKMRFASGNLGIGTTAPSQLLHVNGNVYVTGAYYDSNNNQGASGEILSSTITGTDWISASSLISAWALTGNAGTTAGTNFIGTTDAKDFVFKTNNTERMRISSGGNVGIGSTSPIYPFDLLNSSSTTTAYIKSTYSGSSQNYGLYNNMSATGAGMRTAFYNYVETEGSTNVFGMYNDMRDGTGSGGSETGIFTFFPGNSTSNNTITAYKTNIAMSSSHSSSVYGYYANITSSGSGTHYGVLVNMSNSGTGTHYGVYSDLSGYSTGWAGYFIGKGYFSTNVGIGTTTPSQLLHVNGNAYIKGAYYDSNNSPGSLTDILTSTATGTDWVSLASLSSLGWTTLGNSGLSASANFLGTTDAVDLVIKTSGTEKMRILASTGNVGIGTNAPTSTMHIYDSGGSILNIETSGSTYGTDFSELNFSVSGKTASSIIKDANGMLNISNLNGAYPMKFTIANSSSAYFSFYQQLTELMRITYDGNVGIGTSSPSSQMHIYSSSSPNIIAETANSSGTSNLTLKTPSSGDAYITKYSSTGRMSFGSGNAYDMRFIVNGGGTVNPYIFDEGSTTRMVIDPNGNVGIGNTSPTQVLHVSGSINANGTIYTSDQKFKTNIEEINGALNIITKLNGKSYLFKTEEFPYMGFSSKKQYGFIAQEIEVVLPDLVSAEKQSIPGSSISNEDGTGANENFIDYKGINYTELTPIIVEAIKEMKNDYDTKISDLEKQIQDLKLQINNQQNNNSDQK